MQRRRNIIAEMDSITLLVWISFSILLLLLYLEVERRLSRLPPGPRPLPIIGNILELGKNPHHSLACLAKVYGPVMTLRLGQETTVVISSAEAAREAFQKNDAVFYHRHSPAILQACNHNKRGIAWLKSGQQWRNLRRISITQLFTLQRLDAQEPLRRQKLQELVGYISDRSSKDLHVEIGRAAFATSLNLISCATFSVDFVDLSLESSQEFKDVVTQIMVEIGTPNVSDFFPVLARFDLQGLRRRLEFLFKKMYAFFDEQIDRRLISMEQDTSRAGNDFLDTLLQIQAQDGESNYLDRDTIKSLFLDLFAAGSDTSSSTVEWAMAELLRNPVIMAKAREEITRVVGQEKEVEWSDIRDLPYVQAVIKETLRLHPPTPLLVPHTAGTTTDLHGYRIPEGTRVLVNVWLMGRDGELWKDPDVFSPERFLEKDVDFRGRHFEFIPFGAGRRICPGLPLAVRMVHLTLATMLQRFEWRLPEGMNPEDVDMSEKFGITISMASPLKARAFPALICKTPTTT